MEEELLALFKISKLFSSLDESAHKLMLPNFQKIEITQGEVLFYQGDPSDNIYLLHTGKLAASLTTATGETKFLGYLEPGDVIGEAGALANEPRAITMKAVKKSILFKLPSKDFIELCHAYPAIMFAAIYPIITRSHHLIDMITLEKKNKHIVIMPANEHCLLDLFSTELITALDNNPNVIILSDYQTDILQSSADLLKEKINEFEKNRKSIRKIIYLLKSPQTTLAKISLAKADNLYLAAHHHDPAYITPMILDKLHSRELHHKSLPKLILLHTQKMHAPIHTDTWLSLTRFAIHHHVRLGLKRDYERLIRFIRGKAVGLVLGGGGTRGWAHLGVIKALREEKIPIDMIGGTSVGAIVGACYAIHESYEDAYERFEQVITMSRGSASWRNLTWPAVSLFNAKGFTQSQIDVFDKIHIENLWLPYFAISCNLATNSEEIHQSGLLWERTRASASVPGVIPPMLINGELHLDGGLLNNLPVNVMREFLGNKSKVIAVELNSFSNDRHKYHFPPSLTFWRAVLSKMGFGEKYIYPRFIDMFLRGLLVSSLAKTAQNTLAANLLINLNLHKFRLLHASRKQGEKLVEIGYETATHQIRQMKVKQE